MVNQFLSRDRKEERDEWREGRGRSLTRLSFWTFLPFPIHKPGKELGLLDRWLEIECCCHSTLNS